MDTDRTFLGFVALAAFIALIPVIAYAATDPNTVTVPIGSIVAEWSSAVGWLLASLVLYAMRLLPQNIVAILANARVDLLLNNAIGYGVNAVAGATKDKTLDVNVGNQVLAAAINYAIENSSGWLQTWAGGPEGLAKKVWGKLNLGEGADDAQLQQALALSKVTA